jgi:hypothetical protein
MNKLLLLLTAALTFALAASCSSEPDYRIEGSTDQLFFPNGSPSGATVDIKVMGYIDRERTTFCTFVIQDAENAEVENRKLVEDQQSQPGQVVAIRMREDEPEEVGRPTRCLTQSTGSTSFAASAWISASLRIRDASDMLWDSRSSVPSLMSIIDTRPLGDSITVQEPAPTLRKLMSEYVITVLPTLRRLVCAYAQLNQSTVRGASDAPSRSGWLRT